MIIRRHWFGRRYRRRGLCRALLAKVVADYGTVWVEAIPYADRPLSMRALEAMYRRCGVQVWEPGDF
jgi:hypothetical protein